MPRPPTYEYALAALDARTDECIDRWPRPQRSRYHKVRWMGKNVNAHRLVCILAHGEPPEGQPEAAHSCGNHKCVNPRHLRWASRAENEADKTHHGSRPSGASHPAARLTPEAVAAIRTAFADGATTTQIAAIYGVSRSSAYAAATGRTWRTTTGASAAPRRRRASARPRTDARTRSGSDPSPPADG